MQIQYTLHNNLMCRFLSKWSVNLSGHIISELNHLWIYVLYSSSHFHGYICISNNKKSGLCSWHLVEFMYKCFLMVPQLKKTASTNCLFNFICNWNLFGSMIHVWNFSTHKCTRTYCTLCKQLQKVYRFSELFSSLYKQDLRVHTIKIELPWTLELHP